MPSLRHTSEITSTTWEWSEQSLLYRGSSALSSSWPQGRLQKWLLRRPLISQLSMATDSAWSGQDPRQPRGEKERRMESQIQGQAWDFSRLPGAPILPPPPYPPLPPLGAEKEAFANYFNRPPSSPPAAMNIAPSLPPGFGPHIIPSKRTTPASFREGSRTNSEDGSSWCKTQQLLAHYHHSGALWNEKHFKIPAHEYWNIYNFLFKEKKTNTEFQKK